MTGAPIALSSDYIRNHPKDAARVLENVSAEDAAQRLEQAPAAEAARVLESFSPAFGAACFEKLSAERQTLTAAQMDVSIATALLRRAAEATRLDVLERIEPTRRDAIERLLSFPDGSVGALMDPNPLTLTDDLTVEQALERVRSEGTRVDARIFVLDRDQRLAGCIRPAQLLQAQGSTAIRSLIGESGGGIEARMGAASILVREEWLTEGVLAVVDDGKFAGVVRRETIEGLLSEGAPPMGAEALAHPLLALGELYWVGLCELFGGLSSGQRAAKGPDTTTKGGE